MDELINNLMNTPENTNPNVLRGQLQKIAGSGSGMPDASGLKDGTALIAIDGEFVPAEGYGYLGEEKEIHWDGKYHADEFEVKGESSYAMYLKKISDSPTESETIIVSIYTSEEESTVFTLSNFSTGETSYSMYMSSDFPVIMILAIYNAEDFNKESGMDLSVGTYLYVMSGSSINDGDYLISIDGTVINDIVISYIDGIIKIDKRLYEGSKVSFIQSTQSGTKIGSLIIDDNNYDLYAPNITVNSNFISGTQIATINGTQIYTPNIIINRNLISDTPIATINGIQIYAPNIPDVPVILSGTEEYEDGVTSLANGQIYLQYEV